jgi:hypothetical protein
VVLEVDQVAFKRYYLACLATFLPNKAEAVEATPPTTA